MYSQGTILFSAFHFVRSAFLTLFISACSTTFVPVSNNGTDGTQADLHPIAAENPNPSAPPISKASHLQPAQTSKSAQTKSQLIGSNESKNTLPSSYPHSQPHNSKKIGSTKNNTPDPESISNTTQPGAQTATPKLPQKSSTEKQNGERESDKHNREPNEKKSENHGSLLDETNPELNHGNQKPEKDNRRKTDKHPNSASTQRPPYMKPKECTQSSESSESSASGTGFFINESGLLLTNEHVIGMADEVFVFFEGELILAEIITSSKENDLAALKIKRKSPFILVSKTLSRKGQEVTVLGYPNLMIQGADLKATFGYVNSLQGMLGNDRFIQFSAQIQPGNSGGPVLNSAGELISIATATLNQSYMLDKTGTTAQNVNYGLSLPTVTSFLDLNKIKYNRSSGPVKLKEDVVSDLSSAVTLIIAKRQGKVLICQPVPHAKKNTLPTPKHNQPSKQNQPARNTPKSDPAAQPNNVTKEEKAGANMRKPQEQDLGKNTVSSESGSTKNNSAAAPNIIIDDSQNTINQQSTSQDPKKNIPNWYLFRQKPTD